MKLKHSLVLFMFALFTALACVTAFAEEKKDAAPAAAASAEAPKAPEGAAPAPAPAAATPVSDPSGAGIGVAGDIVGASANAPTQEDLDKMSKAEPLAAKVADVAGHNKISINFVWTLICGFLVMFMQAGFAMAETGFTRAKNAGHTMAMNFMVYALGLLGYWVCGFALQMGGVGGVAALGGAKALNSEFVIHLFGKDFGLFGMKGFFLSGDSYDAAIFTLFLFQMVFMDTTATIPTGSMAERWNMKSFFVYGFFVSAIIYPLYANWVWGGGWLATLGSNFGLGHGHVDFAGSSVVHLTGGVCALAGAMVLGPRLGKFNKDGSANPIPDSRPPYPDGGGRLLYPRLWLVRLQRRFHLGRYRSADWRGCHQYHAGRRCRCLLFLDLYVGALWQAGYLHERQRSAGRPGCHHRAVRLCDGTGRCADRGCWWHPVRPECLLY